MQFRFSKPQSMDDMVDILINNKCCCADFWALLVQKFIKINKKIINKTTFKFEFHKSFKDLSIAPYYHCVLDS